MVLDDEGHSKRFGFISFATVKEAERALERSVIYMHGQKINVGPAVRKEANDYVPTSPVRIMSKADVRSSNKVTANRYRYKFNDKTDDEKHVENKPSFVDNCYTSSSTPPPLYQSALIQTSPMYEPTLTPPPVYVPTMNPTSMYSPTPVYAPQFSYPDQYQFTPQFITAQNYQQQDVTNQHPNSQYGHPLFQHQSQFYAPLMHDAANQNYTHQNYAHQNYAYQPICTTNRMYAQQPVCNFIHPEQPIEKHFFNTPTPFQSTYSTDPSLQHHGNEVTRQRMLYVPSCH